MSLSKYQQKRKFSKTPEPKGLVRSKKRAAKWRQKKQVKKTLSFVVQEHHATRLHYDFRLEMQGVLKSWAVPKGPSMDPSIKHLAVQVEDHPFAYRKFHGTIPKGNYGAGTVSIWDEGTYEPLEITDNPEKTLLAGLKKGDLKFILHGKKLKGLFVLVRMKGEEGKNWLLIKEKDPLPTEKIQPVKTKKIPFPHEIKPMLAKTAEAPFDDPEWIYEIKWDGYRAIAEIQKGKVRLYSRNNQSFNTDYPEVVTALESISHDVILDGEIVALDKDGNAQFQLMQEAHKNKEVKLVYYLFDLLYLDGYDLRSLPLLQRKELLQKLLPKNQYLKYSDHIDTNGKKAFEFAKAKNLEGVMAKRKSSRYVEFRSSEWQKIKNIQMQEAVICGFTSPRGQRNAFGALILGLYDQGEYRYIGHTGGGFDEKSLEEVHKMLIPLVTDKSPFAIIPETNGPATWVKPKIVCEIKFAEWTKDGYMRQPIFLGIRTDKKPTEVTAEIPVEKPRDKEVSSKIKTKVELTNLDKIFWPEDGLTKGDLINYYDQIAPYILPYLEDRPESMLRHPDGITGASFFQKDLHTAPSWVKTVKLHSDTEEKDINWLICNDRDTLLYMANLGCIEINPWNSRLQSKAHPDYLIIDLDPNGADFKEVVVTAKFIKKILDQIKVTGFIKTSGKTGLHILLPLGAKYNYDHSRQFAEILARIVARELPDTTSVTRNPEKREKKIYIDFLQNRLGQTITAPYSLRPVPKACVSTPLEWKELTSSLHPTDFTIKNIFKRLEKKGDLWKKLQKSNGIDLLKSLDRLTKLFPGLTRSKNTL